MSTNKSVAKSATVIAFATLVSRVLGFLRDVVIARLFGVYIYAQAFVVAFRIPNLLRDFVGEGATNAAFVPVFSEYSLKHTKEEFWELANVVLNLLLAVLMLFTLLGILFSPLIVRIIAPGFSADPEKLKVTILLTKIIFPYILLISLAAYAMGILNSLKHFILPAFAPCFLNISIIICALTLGEGIAGLASGVLIGGVLQLAIQVPALYRKGFRLKRPKTLKHPAAREIGKLMLPRVLSTGIYQLNNFVDSIFGSFAWIVGEGGVAVLYFSYRLVQFPIGVFSTALSQAILPTFSGQALEENLDNLRKTFSWGMRATFLIMLPASLALMVLAHPIVMTIFGGGKFDRHSIEATSGALLFYSIGLFAYAGKRIVQSCFFALKDTVTPTKVSALALGLNIVLNALLMFPMKIAGIALATSVSGLVTFGLLYNLLLKRIGGYDSKEICFSFLRILSASLCMGLVCYLVMQNELFPNKYLQLALEIIAGVVSYILFCIIFRVKEIRELWNWAVKRKG